ncbi:MAG: hypothetical protein NC434_05440 [Ruminococcus sp.]|nr:hypothetical protein [Ruminococcus sp.]
MDTSFAEAKAVVTPAFQLKKGIYYLEASYARHGIVKAGLIYHEARNGKELVDDDEFMLDMEEDTLSYRIKIHDDSPIRFKLRLTGDAVDGDYIQLLQVNIVSSRLTYIYSLFWLAFVFLVLDLLYLGYVKYYKLWEPERKMVFLILAFTAFFIGLPLYRNGVPPGLDLSFHLQRLEGIYRGLLSGQFPVRIQPDWLDGYGYAVSVFYGDIFMYFAALLRMIGFTLQDAYKWYIEAVNIATVFISFYAFRRIARDDVSAMVGSVLYAGSIERLMFLYTETLGNYSAMMFYPLVIAGFYLLFTEDEKTAEYKRLWSLLTMGFTGLLMTHMISCLMAGAAAVLGCIVMIRKVLRKNTLRELFKAAFAAIFLNLWFLVPFMQYMLHEKLRINTSLGQTRENSDYYSYLANYTQGGKSLYNFFVNPINIGYALIFVLLFYIVTMPVQKKDIVTKQSRVIFGFTLFWIWVCTDAFPVVGMAKISSLVLKFFATVQSAGRFMGITIAFAACLSVLFFAMKIFDSRITWVAAILLCCLTLYEDTRYFATVTADDIYLDAVEMEGRLGKDVYSYDVGNAEYLPMATVTENITTEIESDEGLQLGDVEREYLTYDISVTNLTNQEKNILLPILYYSGYRTYDDQSGESLQTSAGDNGRVMVTVPADYNGIFHMSYYEPWYWRIAEIASVITLFFILYYIFHRKEFKNVWKLKRLQIPHSVNTDG